PHDAFVLAALGDPSLPLATAEPDLLLPADAVAAFLLDVEDSVHELRELVELRPCLVRLVDRYGDVGPALDRQPPGLLRPAAATATAAALPEHLSGQATADLALGALGGFLAEPLGLVLACVLGGLRQLLDERRRLGGRDGACGAQRRCAEQLLALERVHDRLRGHAVPLVAVLAVVPLRHLTPRFPSGRSRCGQAAACACPAQGKRIGRGAGYGAQPSIGCASTAWCLVTVSTYRATTLTSAHIILWTRRSCPMNGCVTATTDRLNGTRRPSKLGPPSVPSPLLLPKPAARAARSAWHCPQYFR